MSTNPTTKTTQDILSGKTDRQLIEESIYQNIAINKKIETINKQVGFIFVMTLLSLIGGVLYIVGSILSH